MDMNNLKESIEFFLRAFFELSILFLGISFFVEILNEKMNPQKIQKILSSKKSGYLVASLLGSITPFCSCSTIPLTIGLIKAKAGFGPIMTFLFTSPLLNPIIFMVFFITFGLKITIVYASIALLTAFCAGFLLEKLGFAKYIKVESRHNNLSLNTKFSVHNTTRFNTNIKTFQNSSYSTHKNKYKTLLQQTWKQFVSFIPYISIGVAIGAFIHGFIPQELISQYASKDNLLAIPISAIIGIPLYIRASTMVGLAPELISSGVSLGSILALTIAGAGASLPEMIMLKKIFKLPIMIFFLVSVFSMAIICGFLVNIYFT